jgi:hypothetical protein
MIPAAYIMTETGKARLLIAREIRAVTSTVVEEVKCHQMKDEI